MRTSTIEERYADFLACPSVDKFLTVRELIVQLDEFPTRPHFWSELSKRLTARRFAQVVSFCRENHRLACLSPRYHFYWGVSASELGDAEASRTQRKMMQSILRTLLETGDGTEESPFLVTYLGDAYDILKAIGVRPCGQSVVESPEGRWDVISSADGDEFWFDVSDLLGASTDFLSGVGTSQQSSAGG